MPAAASSAIRRSIKAGVASFLFTPVLAPELTFGVVPIEEKLSIVYQAMQQPHRKLINYVIKFRLEVLTGHSTSLSG
jgi:hypothetical protein